MLTVLMKNDRTDSSCQHGGLAGRMWVRDDGGTLLPCSPSQPTAASSHPVAACALPRSDGSIQCRARQRGHALERGQGYCMTCCGGPAAGCRSRPVHAPRSCPAVGVTGCAFVVGAADSRAGFRARPIARRKRPRLPVAGSRERARCQPPGFASGEAQQTKDRFGELID